MSNKVKKFFKLVVFNSFVCFGLTSFMYMCCAKFLNVRLSFPICVSLFILFYTMYFKEGFLKISIESNK